MVFLPLSFGDLAVRINYFPLSIEHRLLEIAFVYFAVFPSEFSRPVDFIFLEIALQHSVLRLNRSLSLSFTIFELTMVLDTTFGLYASMLIMHHAPAEFAHVLATAVFPSVCSGTLLKPRLKPSQVLGVLFADSFDGISLRRSIFPCAFD